MDVIIFLTAFVFILTYLVHAELYFRQLKQKAPDLFVEIGSPSLLRRKQNALPLLRYFVSGAFRKVGHESLVRMGNRLVLHFFLSLTAMLAFMGYMIVSGNFSG
ncbi:MAG: hypothetical protein IPM53_34360 [Anaerolineaceae bacterium]|nr:hypothetical protein [Anaerolineaceae bacterium]